MKWVAMMGITAMVGMMRIIVVSNSVIGVVIGMVEWAWMGREE